MGFLLVAIIFIFAGLLLFLRNWHRCKVWVRTQAVGRVVKSYVHKDMYGDKTLMDQVMYTFKDIHGVNHSFKISDYSGFRDDELRVDVLYSGENPCDVLVDTVRDKYGWASGFFVMGLLLLLFAYFSLSK